MSDFGFFGAETGSSSDPALGTTTPNRRSVLTFDVPENVLIEEAFYLGRTSDQIGKDKYAKWVNTRNIPTIGIQLKPLNALIGLAQEYGTNANTAMMSTQEGGTLNMPPTMANSTPGWRSPTDQPGALTGANSQIASSGFPIYAKDVTSSIQWDDPSTYLASDVQAMPTPFSATNDLYMARVVCDTVPHDGQALFMGAYFPGPAQKATLGLITRYFSATPGLSATFQGTGYYAISLNGDGTASLAEYGQALPIANNSTYIWESCYNFRFCDPQQVFDTAHWIEIRSHQFSAPKNGYAASIIFICSSAGSGGSLLTKFYGPNLNQANSDTTVGKYLVPYFNSIPPKISQPIRGDERRDLVPESHYAKALYPTTGTVLDDPWMTNGLIGVTLDPSLGQIIILFDGDVPNGTSVSLDLFVVGSSDPLPKVDEEYYANGGYAVYDPTNSVLQNAIIGQIGLQTQATLNSPGQYYTPTIYDFLVYKSSTIQRVAPGTWDATPELMAFNKTGAATDPSVEGGNIFVGDPENVLPKLQSRTIVPFTVETEYGSDGVCPVVDWDNPANAYKRTKVMRGYTVDIPGVQMGSQQPGSGDARGNSISSEWRDYNSITCTGEVRRILKCLAPDYRNMSAAVELNGQPYKVTDGLRQFFYWCGYAPAQLDIPDIPLQFFPDVGQGMIIDPRANLIQYINDSAELYLNGWMQFDANAATAAQIAAQEYDGVWRFKQPPNITGGLPYNNLAYFDTNLPPVGTGVTTGHQLTDWPVQTNDFGYPMPGAPIFKKPRFWNEPPELNKLILISNTVMQSGSLFGSLSTTVHRKLTCYNPRSYNFVPSKNTADPNSPDYIPFPEVAREISNTTPSDFSVGFSAGRIMSYAGVGRQFIGFVAPMVLVIDATDTLQYAPRPLQYYDPILVFGNQYLTVSCNPFWTKDGNQLAYYTAQKDLFPIPGLPYPS